MADKVDSGAIDANTGATTIDPKASRWATGSSPKPPLSLSDGYLQPQKKDRVLRTLQRIATVCFIGAALAALVSACGSSDTTTTPPAGTAGAATGTAGAGTGTAGAATGTAGSGTGTLTGNPANGAALFASAALGCNTCHGNMGEGSLGPNITGDATNGIGAWSEADFATAVRSAKNRKGVALCMQMQPFPTTGPSAITDQGIADIYAWLKTQDSAVAQPGQYCMNKACFGVDCTGNQ